LFVPAAEPNVFVVDVPPNALFVAPAPKVFVAVPPEPKLFVKPAPVPIVEAPEEVSVVNAPVLAVPLPIVPGAAHVPPSNWLALIPPELGTPPAYTSDAPAPTTIAAVVFVPLVILLNGTNTTGVFVQLGVAPAPLLCSTIPAVPAAPFI
jgi:hypothetical protein